MERSFRDASGFPPITNSKSNEIWSRLSPHELNQKNKLNNNNIPTTFDPLPNIQFNGYDPKTMFNNNNFVNKGDIMHNNLKDILLNEEIREFSVMIDSKDRNYQIYPDPYSYEVRFNPRPKYKEKVNGKLVVHEEPAPVINENFENVRYVKLDSIILPYFNKITKTKNLKNTEDNYSDDDSKENSSEGWVVNSRRPTTDNLYTVLSIGNGGNNNYNDNNYRSTNDVLSDSFAIIYYDSKINGSHYMGYTSNGIKIYPQDQLGKIDKMRINFLDPYGNNIRCSHLDKNIKSNCECNCEDSDGDEDTDCFIHNLFHPLNPIFQHHIQLKIGVVEPRLGKKIFN
jgi:hypothetical protein